jgi:hypothetical protein
MVNLLNNMKTSYIILKKAISEELANFCSNYLLLKRRAMETLHNTGNLPPLVNYYGTYEDGQVHNTFSTYGDIAMEVLLEKLKPLMETKTGLSLNCMYAYARVYKKGDVLKRHKDRKACEISTTLNLGGDPWSIFLEPSGKRGKKGIEVKLSPGDMLIYKGCDVEHWRNEFKGDLCTQVFLHYRDVKISKNNFDGRPHLGLPYIFYR